MEKVIVLIEDVPFHFVRNPMYLRDDDYFIWSFISMIPFIFFQAFCNVC